MSILDLLTYLGTGISVAAVLPLLFGWIPQWKAWGYIALGNTLELPGSLRDHVTGLVGMNVAFIIWGTWCWWKGGGGDGTKRRLRKLAEKFEGVRRTAPQAA